MSKTKNSKRLDKLQEEFLNLEHCICCDVEILQEVEYDSATKRKQIATKIMEWNKLYSDVMQAQN